MSLLFKVLFCNGCKNLHHKLVLDSLRFMRGPHSENWRNLFVKHHTLLLSGASAPDDDFKDFKNHVLHVKENNWGGAVASAKRWYQRVVETVSDQAWFEAIYAVGVLSHYVTDPLLPMHTAMSESAGKVHHALEWSTYHTYSELQQIVETDLGGYPHVQLAEGGNWLDQTLREGATAAYEHYQPALDHYNLALGVKDPPSGLDQELKDRMAKQISLAAVTFARVLDRAIAESQTTPPDVFVTLEGMLATMQSPLPWMSQKMQNFRERAIVEAIYDEVQQTGKALLTLPEDEKIVRRLHAQEVLRVSLNELDAKKPEPTGRLHGKGAGIRWRLPLPVFHEPRIPATPPQYKAAA